MQIDDNYRPGPALSVYKALQPCYHKILLVQTSSFSNIKYVYTSEQIAGDVVNNLRYLNIQIPSKFCLAKCFIRID